MQSTARYFNIYQQNYHPNSDISGDAKKHQIRTSVVGLIIIYVSRGYVVLEHWQKILKKIRLV